MKRPTLEAFDMLIKVAYSPHKELNGYNVSGEGIARIGDANIPIKVSVGLAYTSAPRVTTRFSLEVHTDDLSDVIEQANRRATIPQLEEPKNKA